MKKKQFVIYATIATLSTCVLTGCSRKFSYNINENGEIEAVGTIDYDYLDDWDSEILTIHYADGKDRYFLTHQIESMNLAGSGDFIDLLTNKSVLNIKNLSPNVASYDTFSVIDYMVEIGNIKEKYSVTDIKNILAQYEESQKINTTDNGRSKIK